MRNKRGFTLIAILIAAVLFLAAATGFGYLLKIGAASTASADRLDRAVCAMQSTMEGILYAPFDSLSSMNGRTFADGHGKISIIPALTDLVRIELELEWNPDKLPIKLYTLRSLYP